MGTYAAVGQQADDEITRLSERLAAVTVERDDAAAQLAACSDARDADLAEIAELLERVRQLTADLADCRAATPTPTPGGWTRNGLPPVGRTLFGAATQNLADTEQRIGKLGLFRSYFQAGQVAGMVQRAQADHAAGRIPWISSKLPVGWAQAATGGADAWATDLANRLGALGKPVWVALHHEPEGDGTPADWVKLQQRLSPIFRKHPTIANTIILMGWGQWQDNSQPMATWWPGKEHVHILAFDPYNWYDTTNSGGKKTMGWTELKTYYDKITAWLKATGNDTVRWAIAETGYSDTASRLPQGAVSTRGTGADWITRAYDDMKQAGGIALTYFNVPPSVNGAPADRTWPITTDPKQAAVRAVNSRADRWPG